MPPLFAVTAIKKPAQTMVPRLRGNGETPIETISGSLRCGVSISPIGFAEPQDDDSFNRFGADLCRAVAAVIYGDADSIEFVGVTATERFAVLASGEVDVLFRNTTWTQSRDSELGGDFGPITFYDGQKIMGKAEFGFNEGGNYDEIYSRNLHPLDLIRTGSDNAAWTDGGLIYAPPAR